MDDQRSIQFAVFAALTVAVTAVAAGLTAYILTMWVRTPLVEAGLVTAVSVEHEARALAVGIGVTVLLIGSVLSVISER